MRGTVTRFLVASAPDGGGGGILLVDTERLPEQQPARLLARAGGLGCLVRHPRMPVLYGLGAAPDETVHVWRLRGEQLDHLSAARLPGTGACAAAIVGKHLVIAHYSSGEVTSMPLDGDGVPQPGITTTLTGAGPDRSRQDQAHPHHVLDQDGLAVVTDLGSDCLWSLRPADLAVAGRRALPAGCGPRHTARLPGSRYAVTGELDMTLILVPDAGEPVSVASSAGSAHPSPRRVYPSDLVAHPGGLVAVANRNAGTVALIDCTDAGPQLVDEQACGGLWPLNLALAGDTVAVAQRDDNALVLLDIDPAARSLGPARAVPVPRPTWVLAAT